MFLHIWLRREEQKIKQVLILAQGLTDAASAAGGQSHVSKRFKEFVEIVFPFMATTQTEENKKMLEAVQKEVSKGPITFSPIQTNPFKKTAKMMTMPDEFKKKLEEKANKLRLR